MAAAQPRPKTALRTTVGSSVPGRDHALQGWYGAACRYSLHRSFLIRKKSRIDHGPIDASKLVIGGFWAGYYYNGYIYGSEIARGLDVFELTPTADLTQNEIDAAKLVRFDQLNPQSQPKLVWPAAFAVARIRRPIGARQRTSGGAHIGDLERIEERRAKERRSARRRSGSWRRSSIARLRAPAMRRACARCRAWRRDWKTRGPDAG
jgi:hypothetical protein